MNGFFPNPLLHQRPSISTSSSPCKVALAVRSSVLNGKAESLESVILHLDERFPMVALGKDFDGEVRGPWTWTRDFFHLWVNSVKLIWRKWTHGPDSRSLTIERSAQLVVLEICSASMFLFSWRAWRGHTCRSIWIFLGALAFSG